MSHTVREAERKHDSAAQCRAERLRSVRDPLQNDTDQGSEGRRWSCGRPVCGSPGGTVLQLPYLYISMETQRHHLGSGRSRWCSVPLNGESRPVHVVAILSQLCASSRLVNTMSTISGHGVDAGPISLQLAG